MTAEAPPAIDLDGLLRRLHLPTVRRLYPDLAARAEAEGMAYRDFLALLIAEEVAHRAQTRIQRCVRRARFPFLKTIDEYDFTFQTGLRLSLLGSALSPEFVTQGHGLILGGPPGTGKTHLVVAIADRAIQNGFDALFTTAAELIDHLSGAAREGKLRHLLPTYTHVDVLVIDEVGYLSYGPDAANVLFQVVNDRYLHRRPLLFTTNKPLGAWGRVLHDADLAEAILDRVLERGRHIELRGPSYRTRHAGLDLRGGPEPGSTSPARFSGKHRPDFPEPTARNAADRRNRTRERYPQQSAWFLARGFAVVIPMRRGYAASEGEWAEGGGPCWYLAGRESAKDIRAAVEFMQARPFVDRSRVLLVGQSAGGFGVLALAAEGLEGLKGVINFAGGRGSPQAGKNCSPENVIYSMGEFGRTTKVPTLWIYTENDSYFSVPMIQEMHGAFRKAGGDAELLLLPPFGKDGHLLFSRGTHIWSPAVEAFLERLGLVDARK